MAQNLIGVPENAEVWLVNGVTRYIVYYVPNSEPPIPIAWEVPDVESITALGIESTDRAMSREEFRRSGALPMGTTNEIPNPGPGVHPFDVLVSEYATEVQVKPWLADPEILALWAGAAIEGRSISPAELQTSEWWQTHTETERAWISLNASDPATAAQRIEDTRLQVANLFRNAGVANATDALVNRVADMWTQGSWSEAYAVTQIQALSDPFSELEVDEALTPFQQNLDTTRGREEEVRSLVSRWLGSAYSQGWSDDAVARWAGELRNNPDALTELTEALRSQRMSLFPEYTNPNLTYDDVASVWRGVWQGALGEVPDETNALFSRIVRMNDLEGANQLLRKEGLKQGNANVANDLLGDVNRAFGGQIIKVGGFR